ncbi:uncharacterized protein EDB91DRAFT_1085665 [Suillus paluster]|uniref:uncharacterized protein n=1 Tax=Suillus paluster TaxID=48578 RepID=UPI001B85ED72|nr:uncharacterized protein EDB91DRAFT_1085665 [Suillus paluster]KAG1729631.1 hypothetical protein EDB91DRAFT_1085665 [Suillus paluster]
MYQFQPILDLFQQCEGPPLMQQLRIDQQCFSTGTAPLQRSAVTSLSTSRVPSTAFVDKLANLNMIIVQLADKFDRLALQSRDSVEFKPQIEELTQENHTLRATVEDHHAAIHELQTTIDAQSTSLEELLMLTDKLRSSGNALPTVKSVNKATKAMCDNVFNNAIQHTFLHAMGISDSKQAMSLGVLDDENADWHEDMVRYVRQKACEVFTQLPVEHLKQKTDTDIIKQLKEVFENTRGSIKKGSKGQDSAGENIKRSAIDIRKETEMHRPKWDWFFQVGYQLTDESDGGGTHSSKPMVEFASDSEAGQGPAIKKSFKSKNADTVWTSQPPLYRDEQVNEKVVLLNDAVNLPKLANKKHKIPWQFIDANWLDENLKMDCNLATLRVVEMKIHFMMGETKKMRKNRVTHLKGQMKCTKIKCQCSSLLRMGEWYGLEILPCNSIPAAVLFNIIELEIDVHVHFCPILRCSRIAKCPIVQAYYTSV